MPLYDFHCEDCGYNFEELTRYHTVSCRMCASPRTTKMMTSFGSYKVLGNNDASTSPKNSYSREMDRRAAKRERMDNFMKKGKFK